MTVGSGPTVLALALVRALLVRAALRAEGIAEAEAERTFVDVVALEHGCFPASIALAGDAVVAWPKAPLAVVDHDVAELGASDFPSLGVGGTFRWASAAHGDIAVCPFKALFTGADHRAGAVIAASVDAGIRRVAAQQLYATQAVLVDCPTFVAVARRRANAIEAIAVQAIDSDAVIDPFVAAGAVEIDWSAYAIGDQANTTVLARRCTAGARSRTVQAGQTRAVDEATGKAAQRHERANPYCSVHSLAHSSMKQTCVALARLTCVIL